MPLEAADEARLEAASNSDFLEGLIFHSAVTRRVTPAVVVGGAACFGTGFGILQNATLAMMYARAPRGAYDAVSAIWNAAWDAGMGAGAAAIGLLAATAGYPAAFVITAALVLPALVAVLRERSRAAHAAAPGIAEPAPQDEHPEGSKH